MEAEHQIIVCVPAAALVDLLEALVRLLVLMGNGHLLMAAPVRFSSELKSVYLNIPALLVGSNVLVYD
jgi:hypothetical protein